MFVWCFVLELFCFILGIILYVLGILTIHELGKPTSIQGYDGILTIALDRSVDCLKGSETLNSINHVFLKLISFSRMVSHHPILGQIGV